MNRLQYLLSSSDSGAEQAPEPRVIDIGEDDAEGVFTALSSEVPRQILIKLREEPAIPADLAEELDTSIQNIHYHLRKLKDVDLVEPVDTRYSEKGIEMNVYAPTSEPLLVTSTTEERRATIRTVVKELFGVVSILAIVSVGVHWYVTTYLQPSPMELLSGAGPKPIVISPAIPPGLLFFVGGIAMLVLVLFMYTLAPIETIKTEK